LCNIRLETNLRQSLQLLLQRQYIEEEELRLKHYVEVEKFKKNLPKPVATFNVDMPVICSQQNMSSLVSNTQMQQSPEQQTHQFYQQQWVAAMQQQQSSVGLQNYSNNFSLSNSVVSPISQQQQQQQQQPQQHQAFVHQVHQVQQIQQQQQKGQSQQTLQLHEQNDTMNLYSISPIGQQHLITSNENNATTGGINQSGSNYSFHNMFHPQQQQQQQPQQHINVVQPNHPTHQTMNIQNMLPLTNTVCTSGSSSGVGIPITTPSIVPITGITKVPADQLHVQIQAALKMGAYDEAKDNQLQQSQDAIIYSTKNLNQNNESTLSAGTVCAITSTQTISSTTTTATTTTASGGSMTTDRTNFF